MPLFHLLDHSCHRRQEEVSLVRRFFRANGWSETTALAAADCVLLFTCAGLRHQAARMVQTVAELVPRIAPGARFMVGSCLPGTDPVALAQVFQGPILTPTDFSALDALPGIRVRMADLPPAFGRMAVCRAFPRRSLWRSSWIVSDRLAHRAAARVRRAGSLGIPMAAGRLAGLTRSPRLPIHVAAGCAMPCSYCAIRFATGPLRSKPLDIVLATLAEGLRRGYRSFDLLADSLGGYGQDQGTHLGALLDQFCAHPAAFTIGLSDLHPQAFLRHFEAIRRLCDAGRLHTLEVEVQSGSEAVLRRMKRPCDLEDLTRKLLVLRCYPGLMLRTGILVGFPGETAADFAQSLALLRRVAFDAVQVHCYSDMPDTEASTLGPKIDPATLRDRLDQLGRAGIRFDRAEARRECEHALAGTAAAT